MRHILSCAFASCDNFKGFDILSDSIDNRPHHRVRCLTCGATGPYGVTIAGAVLLWNARDVDETVADDQPDAALIVMESKTLPPARPRPLAQPNRPRTPPRPEPRPSPAPQVQSAADHPDINADRANEYNTLDEDQMFDRAQASAYLTTLGHPIAIQTLASYMGTEKGPRVAKDGFRPMYRVGDLHEWVHARKKTNGHATGANHHPSQ